MPDTFGDRGATVVRTGIRRSDAQTTLDPIFDIGKGRQLVCIVGLGEAKR